MNQLIREVKWIVKDIKTSIKVRKRLAVNKPCTRLTTRPDQTNVKYNNIIMILTKKSNKTL